MPAIDLTTLQRRIRVARGQEPGDLALKGGQVINVFTRRLEAATVVIADGWIAGVGPYDWKARQAIDVAGRVIAPGFIDSHMHLESTLLTPAELARLIVPHGTTATISDSHEIGNVLGTGGIDLLLAASVGLPFDLFFTASSCVPATNWEHAGAVLGPAEVRTLLEGPRMLGLAEVMDFPAVLGGEPNVLEKIRAAFSLRKVVDGHAPGMTGTDLQAYVAAGIRSDHESATMAEARAKAAAGMLVQVREGSVAHNLDALLPLLAANELGDDWCLVTDDVFPNDLQEHGHLDSLLRRVVAAGVPAADAVRHVTLVPARHYGLRDRGAVAAGYRADLVVLNEVRTFAPRLVIKDGKAVARDGSYVFEGRTPPVQHSNSIHLGQVSADRFALGLQPGACPVIAIVPGQILTRAETRDVQRQDGHWAFEPGNDVALIASLERHRAMSNIGVGLVSGFGFRKHGALGSSVAHDSHNLIVAGTNASDMHACVQALAEMGGGFVVVAGGEVRARVPLPIAGLLSSASADTVCKQLQEAHAAARALGCELAAPFGQLSFLALPVIPDLRITDQGLFDVNAQKFLKYA